MINPDEIPFAAGIFLSLLLCAQWRRGVVADRRRTRRAAHELGEQEQDRG